MRQSIKHTSIQSKSCSVLLVDDHTLVRKGVMGLLAGMDAVERVLEAKDGHEALAILDQEDIDLVLLDINMPKMNGIQLGEMISNEYPHVKSVVLSMHFEESYVRKALQAGIMGYLLKNTDASELEEAIQTVLAGDSYISPEVSKIMMSRYMRNQNIKLNLPDSIDPNLSDREVEVLKLIAQEFTNKEIAEKLFISPRTVDSHRRNLMEKLCCKNTAGLVKYAVIKGFAA